METKQDIEKLKAPLNLVRKRLDQRFLHCNGTLKEIRIMEASNSINNQTKAFEELNPPSMTTLFHTKVNSPTPVLPHTPSTPGKSEPLCVYCNGVNITRLHVK